MSLDTTDKRILAALQKSGIFAIMSPWWMHARLGFHRLFLWK